MAETTEPLSSPRSPLAIASAFADKVFAPAITLLDDLGATVLLTGQAAIWLVRPPYRWAQLLIALDFIGAGSTFIVGLVGLFTGMAFTVSTIVGFRQFSAEGMVGGVVALAMARELAPVLAAVVVTARAGSTMASELGNMRVSEQIDAITTMGVSPIQYLVVPRIVATTAMLPLLSVAFGMAGMLGAYLVAVVWQNIDPGAFFDRIHTLVEMKDLRMLGIKATVFGLILSVTCCNKGFHASGGARGVGEATAKAVVASIVAIFAADYVLTAMLTEISKMDGPHNLVTLFRRATESHASRPLLAYEKDGRWTHMLYADLARDEVRLRAALARLGVGRGDKVAIISKNRPEWVVVMVAVHALGAVVVPMYEVQHVDDWRHILRDAKAKLCFASSMAIDAKVREMLGDLPALAHVVTFDRAKHDDTSYARLLETAHAGDAPFVTPDPRDDAAYIYTSGTTGKPKGVRLSHAAFAFEARALRDAWSVTPGDRSISILPWAHVGGFCELILDAEFGACAAVVGSFDKLGEAIRETHPTLIGAVPRVWNALYDVIQKGIAEKPPAVRSMFDTAIAAEKKKRAGLRLRKRERAARRVARKIIFPKIHEKLGGSLRQGFSGAAALSKEVQEFFTCLGIDMYEVYGQTETGAISTVNRPGAVKLGTVGKPLAGVRIEIDTTVGDADDGSGEIVIHTPGAMTEYHGLPDETRAVRRADGAIRTGDLGRLDADGFLTITGRLREVYKLENGKFVTPVPIEESLGLSPYIAQAFVWGLNKTHNVALLVVDAASLKKWGDESGVRGEVTTMVTDSRVRELFLREVKQRTTDFKGYERIVSFALLTEAFTTDNGLLTPTLKVKRQAVLAKHRALLDSLYA